jgi:hypothetical protein
MATIEHPERQGVEINIPTYFILRDSTAPPSGLAQKRDVNRQVAKYENTV